ncbi:MAG: hypothetical protein QW579_06350 [Desulfurococcaceae archaeon]
MSQEQDIQQIEYKVKIGLTIDNDYDKNYYSIAIRVEGYTTIGEKRLAGAEETVIYGINGENVRKVTREDIENVIADFKKRIAERFAEALKIYNTVKQYSEENGYDFGFRVI